MILKRGVLTDHYVEGDRSVVMVDESVLGLSPIATTILEVIPDGAVVTVEVVTQHIVDTFGPPNGTESAEDLTRQQLWDLAAHGVLIIGDEGSNGWISPRPSEYGQERLSAERPEAVDALRDALRHLRSATLDEWRPPEAISATALISAARQHHVVPYLAAHLNQLALPGRANAELEAMASRQRAGATLLAADLSLALGALNAAGVRALAFKGVALASQAYGDFAVRGAGDLDVLVPAKDVTRAHRALSVAGWSALPGHPFPGDSWAWRHFVRTGYELTLTSETSAIDLHWHLAPTRATFPEFEELWLRHDVVTVDGRPVPTLSRYDALAHSAGHAAKDGWRWLRSLLDVHLLASDGGTWLDADRPLRPDQLRTVGLTGREFGIPTSAPSVVYRAARQIDVSLLEQVRGEQGRTAPEHRPLATPGLQLLRRLRIIRLTGGSFRESARLISRTALPPWITAQESSRHAVIAVPRVLRKRISEVVSRLVAKRDTARDEQARLDPVARSSEL